jgi:hypothetical protein
VWPQAWRWALLSLSRSICDDWSGVGPMQT